MAYSLSSCDTSPLPAFGASRVVASGGSALKASGSSALLASAKSSRSGRSKREKISGLFSRVRFRIWGSRNGQVKQSGEHSKEETRLRTFSYEELNKATENFSPNRIIGKGGSGVVYRGILRGSGNIAQGGSNGRGGTTVDVAVKMIIGPTVYEEEDYIAEIQVIGRLQHPNVVRLLGWCVYGRQLLLVHEFMPNGGLDSHLYKPDLPHLPWEVRYSRVVAGLASSLDYLQLTRGRNEKLLLMTNRLAKLEKQMKEAEIELKVC